VKYGPEVSSTIQYRPATFLIFSIESLDDILNFQLGLPPASFLELRRLAALRKKMKISMAIRSLRKPLLHRTAHLGNPPPLPSFPKLSEFAVSIAARPRPIVASSAALEWRTGERTCRRGGFCSGSSGHSKALGSCFYSNGGAASSSYSGGSGSSYLELTDEELMRQCEMSTFKSSGPGGQHRNKRESAVRLKHIPTGIIAQVSSVRFHFLVVLELARVADFYALFGLDDSLIDG